VLVKLFFTPSDRSQTSAWRDDREPLSGPAIAGAQLAAFRDWEGTKDEQFRYLRTLTQPCLVVNGVFDQMILVRNSYLLSEHLPNAVLLTYPDAGHGSLFQHPESFAKQALLFLERAGLRRVGRSKTRTATGIPRWRFNV
jgi:pimeloyl-ACP methyl ester carboxylesterase